MAFRLGDRARETSTAPGTGSFTVNGVVQGAQTLASVLTSNADTSWYFATNGTAWEVGLLTRTSATVFARTTIFASSNGGAVVNFSTGLVDIALDLPASVVDALNLTEITVASATTTDIGAVQGAKIVISGTTTITGLGTSANKLRFVRFSGALTLTHHATSLILPGATNIVTVAGDTATFTSDSSGNWRCHNYLISGTAPFDRRAPGPIGSTTPSTGTFTSLSATAAPGTSVALSGTSATVSIANGANSALAVTAGIVFVKEGTSGAIAIYNCQGGTITTVNLGAGGIWIDTTTTPGAGKATVAFSSPTIRIYNNTGATSTFSILQFGL